jgi:hypothetical protein
MVGTFTKLMSVSQANGGNHPPQSQNRTEMRAENRSHEEAQVRPEKRTELPYKRATKRYSFEFYVDQVQAIRKMKVQAEMEGKSLNQSDIVRQALDEYLSKNATSNE